MVKPKDIWCYLEFFFNKKLAITLMKSYLQSRIWKYLAIQQEDYLWYIIIYYTEFVYSPLHYTDSTKSILFCLAKYHKTSVEKKECNSILEKWQIYFQASYYKGKNFLDLNNNDSNIMLENALHKKSNILRFFSI